VRGRKSSPREMIRSLCPLDLDDVEQYGFPIVVDGKTGSVPHKPLCFLCGSAGIEQVLFFLYSYLYLILVSRTYVWLLLISMPFYPCNTPNQVGMLLFSPVYILYF
jgi:hypothetical protein